MIDNEIQTTLNIDPSPEFVARVRGRIAREPAPSRWRWSWTAAAAAAGAMAAALVVAVAVTGPRTPRQSPPASPHPRVADLVLRSPGAPAVPKRVTQAPRPAAARQTPRAIEPGILIDPREELALRRLLAGVRAGRVDLAAVTHTSAPAAMELPAIRDS